MGVGACRLDSEGKKSQFFYGLRLAPYTVACASMHGVELMFSHTFILLPLC